MIFLYDLLCPDESAVEVANGEELRDIAAGDGPAADAGSADDGEPCDGDLDQGLELGGLLGGALGEEAHGALTLLLFGPVSP